MKKRVFSLFMALALCLSMLPAAAMAEDEGISTQAAVHDHCICGATHEKIGDHNDKETVTFDQVLDVDSNDDFTANGEKISNYYSNGLPAGNYYLEKSITIKKSIKVYSGTVNICLNGHNITLEDNGNNAQAVFYVATHGTRPAVLNLTNCGNIVGKVTHSNGCTGSGVTLGNSSSAKGEVFNLYGGEITGNTVAYGGAGVNVGSVAYNGVAEDGCTFNMYGGAITGNTVSSERNSGGGVSLGTYSKFNLYAGVIKNNSSTYYGGGVSVAHESEFVMSGGEISENAAVYGGGVSTSLGALKGLDPSSFTMTGGTITKNTASQGGGVYHGGETFKVSGDATITENTANGKTDNVYLRTNDGKTASITIGKDGLADSARIGVRAKEPAAGLVVATGATENKDYTKIITSDDDTYKVAHDSTDGTKLVLVSNTPAPTEEHKHCICGETHTNVGDHTSESQTTFEKKLWMDGTTLKMGDKEWTLGEVERADSSSGDKEEGYALSEGTYYLGTDLKLNGTPILIGGDVKLCLNGHTIDQAYRSGAISSLIRVVGKNAHLTLTDCVGTGKLTGGKYGGVDVFGGCTLDMFGGTITGNEINGGVSIGQIGTFNMYDGKITGNRAGYGGGVLNGGTFNMYGGEISGNTAINCGGGVYVDSYSTVFKVSGAAKITDNTVDNAANNVYLPSRKTFTLGSHFTRDTYIGVTTAEKPEGSETVTIASNVGELNYENYVKADDSEKYEVKRSNGGLVLAVKNGGTTPTEHKHFLCGGDSCTCPVTETKKVEFQPWESTTSLPKDTGNYYLTANVELDSYWKPADGTVLCLNGYSITVNKDTESVGRYIGAIVVESGRTFTLADCKGGKTEYGQLTHGTNTETNSKYTGGGVCVYGTFNMYGGNITGNELTQKWYCGGGVSVHAAAGIFNLYGGSITDNKSNNTSTGSPCGEGGGVYTIGKFTMYGGTISGNEAHRSGGGVYAAGDFTMEGGTISNNTAKGKYSETNATYSGGGGVFVAGKATFTMKNGTISDNTVYGPGGGVYVAEPYGSFVMENGTISGNTALTNNESYSSGEGGGVFVRNCTFTMENGSITGNSAVKNGGGVCTYGKFTMRGGIIGGAEESDANTAGENGSGVYVDDGTAGGYCKMSGDVKIIGNKKNGEANNYYGRTITIGTDGLGNNAKIGMNMGSSWPTGTYGTRIAYKAKESDQGKFTSDKEGYEIKYYADYTSLYLRKKSDPQPGKVDAGVKITAENANDPAPTEVVYGDTFNLGTTLQTTGTAGSPQSSKWTWSSSDDSILAVTGSGSAATVRALKSGEATITVTYESENAKGTATAPITVNQRQISVKVDDKEMTVGGALPTFTVTYGNFASGDTADTVLETKTPSTAADGKTAGSFDITVEAPTIKSNYADKYTVGTPQKGTLTVNAAENPPQPSSGSSSRPSYSVSTPGKTENGSVSADVKNAKKGSTVTITVKPEDGFKLADLTVTDKNGNELALTDKGDGKYTFTMPAGKVEISAAFAEEIETSPFEDVAADAYYYEAVKWAAEQGITEGTGKGLFGPEGTCTRGQIVTFLWRAAGSPVVNYAMDLADVDEDAYYAEAVRWALSEGVTSGTTDTTFAPDATCTRAQAMTFLFKAMKAAAEGKADFKDVADSDWFASAVAWAVENGVTAGVGGGLFGPDNDCTRGQIVTFLWKLYAGK